MPAHIEAGPADGRPDHQTPIAREAIGSATCPPTPPVSPAASLARTIDRTGPALAACIGPSVHNLTPGERLHPLCPRTRPRRLVALCYITTTAVPLAVTISIEPFWPTVS
jgi:hypothetical protein